MTEESFYSTPQIPEYSIAARNIMKDMKTPYLSRIQHAKSNFSQKKQNHLHQQTQKVSPFQQIHLSPMASPEAISSRDISEKNIHEHTRKVTQSSCQQTNQKKNQDCCREWKLGSSSNSRFDQLTQITDYYNKVFSQKIKFSNGRKVGGDSFKLEEKQVIEQIYEQLANHQEHTVSFGEVHKFFKKCTLFYRIYNIHPDSLQDVLNEFAHHYEDKLTEQEFFNFFLLNNRTNQDYQNYNIQKIFKKCILDEDSWKDLKDIFDLFDTFGNSTIQIKKFFRKLTNSHQYKYLLKKDVIYFPNIKRFYSLKKILFELQNKLNISDKICEWEQIKAYIFNFSHIKEPTLDFIVKKQISQGIITPFSNNFMLNNSLLTQVKQIFSRCPKYCSNFVKVSQFCYQVFQSLQNTDCMYQVVRKEPQLTTFKSVLKQLNNQQLEYLDLDELLQWFSIKGFQNQISQQKNKKSKALSIQSSSDEEDFNIKRRIAEKNKKSIQNLPSKYPKLEQKSQVTLTKEFNLTKKSKQSIRDQKVKQMIEEKQQKQMEQCSKKFKAHAIPASINNEKYEEYKAAMNINKESILAKLNAKKDKQKITLQYLQANTKLFEKPKKIEHEEKETFTFRAEPAPWFTHLELLDQINAEKQAKLKKLKRDTSLKYLKDWKNLPTFLYDPNYQSTPDISKEGTYKLLVNNCDEGQIHEDCQKVSKVKQIPDFKMLHQQFQQTLESKKKHFNPTVIQQFQLSSPRVKPVQTKKSESQRNVHQKVKIQSSRPLFIGSTLKYESLVKHNQEKKIQQQIQKQYQIQNQQQKKKQDKIFAKIVQKQLRKELNKGMKSTGSTVRSKKSRTASKNKSNKKELADIYQRVFSRPFLFQEITNKKGINRSVQVKAKPINLTNENSAFLQGKFIEKLYPSQALNNQNQLYEEDINSEIASRNSI